MKTKISFFFGLAACVALATNLASAQNCDSPSGYGYGYGSPCESGCGAGPGLLGKFVNHHRHHNNRYNYQTAAGLWEGYCDQQPGCGTDTGFGFGGLGNCGVGHCGLGHGRLFQGGFLHGKIFTGRYGFGNFDCGGCDNGCDGCSSKYPADCGTGCDTGCGFGFGKRLFNGHLGHRFGAATGCGIDSSDFGCNDSCGAGLLSRFKAHRGGFHGINLLGHLRGGCGCGSSWPANCGCDHAAEAGCGCNGGHGHAHGHSHGQHSHGHATPQPAPTEGTVKPVPSPVQTPAEETESAADIPKSEGGY